MGRAVYGVGGGQTRQVEAAGRSEPLDGGRGVLGPQGGPGSNSEPVSAGMGSWGFGCDCPGRSWQKCPARERSYFSMGLALPVFCGSPYDSVPCMLPPPLAVSLCLYGLGAGGVNPTPALAPYLASWLPGSQPPRSAFSRQVEKPREYLSIGTKVRILFR